MSVKEYLVPEGGELRVEAYPNKLLKLTLISGGVEINGLSIRENQTIEIINRNFYVFAWFNSKIRIAGDTHNVYPATESLVPIYFNIHKQLQAERNKALPSSGLNGPRIMILGRRNSGKFTVAQTLLNYAVRYSSTPIYMDMDIESGNIAIPGCMSALVTSKEEILNPKAQTFNSSPCVQFYGYQQCMTNPHIFRRCLNNLIDDVNTRMEKDQSAARGGLIVNGGSWYEEDRSFPLLKEMIDRLDIGAVFVLHDGRIYSELRTTFPTLCVVQLDVSAGILNDDNIFNDSITRYFRGDIHTTCELSTPIFLEKELNEIQVYAYHDKEWWRRRNDVAVTGNEEDYLCEPYEVETSELLHQVLAVTNVKDKKDIPNCSIMGFVFVNNVDEQRKILSLQPPIAGELPGTILLKGAIKWN